MMTPKEYLLELAFPARSPTTILAMILFAFLLGLIGLAGILGVWLAFAVLPAMALFLIRVAEARAEDRDVDPPSIESYTPVGNLWALFPALPLIAVAAGARWVRVEYGQPELVTFGILVALIFPAIIGVLMITHSPTQAMNPTALYRFATETGRDYLYAAATFAAMFLISVLGVVIPVIGIFYLIFAFFAVVGAIARGGELVDDVYLPDPVEPEVDDQLARLERQRVTILNHAYGLASRGNRQGALAHIVTWLGRDPDPADGWSWFFEQMLNWEDTLHALYYAQHYVAWLLARGEKVRATKLILRARTYNARFRPANAQMPAAIEAARSCGNEELADALERL